MKISQIPRRVAAKLEQIASFFRHTRTPLSLSLDAVRLKRSAFVAVGPDGLRLRLRPNCGEGFTFYENLIRRDYYQGGIVLRPGDTVLDVGANIGAFSVLAAATVGPRGRVVSFEPVEETFVRLQENIALNGLQNVECRRAAIAAAGGTLALHIGGKSAYATAHHDLNEEGHRGVQVVDCLSMARALDEYQIDRIALLKLDCEGSEYGIIDSLTPELASRIDQIAMEVHPVEGESTDRLADSLRALGFQVRIGSVWVARRLAERPDVVAPSEYDPGEKEAHVGQAFQPDR